MDSARPSLVPTRPSPGPAALPGAALVLIAAAAGIAVAGTVLAVTESRVDDWSALAMLVVLGMAAERYDIDLYKDSRLSISALFLLTAAIIVGPAGMIFVAPAIAIAGHVGRGRPFYKLIFNASQFAGSGLACAYVFRGLTLVLPGDAHVIEALAAMAAACVDFGISSVLVSTIIALTAASRPASVWREKFLWLAPHYLLLGFLAFVLAIAYAGFGLYGVLGFIAPALMTRFTMKQYVDRTEQTVTELREKHAEVQALSVELQQAYSETLIALVSALDLRDTETHGHSERVTELSLTIGEALGIERGSREWKDLKHGAMLHDVGKVGVPDAILRKPGPLNEEEWRAIREHPMHGYQMLRKVQFLSRAGELVLCHHERFDGKGYPRGLQGTEIPLAARIFAVADTFDAITSPRPYKPAYSEEAACAEIAANSGTQFDPQVVAELLRLMRYAPVQRAA